MGADDGLLEVYQGLPPLALPSPPPTHTQTPVEMATNEEFVIMLTPTTCLLAPFEGNVAFLYLLSQCM